MKRSVLIIAMAAFLSSLSVSAASITVPDGSVGIGSLWWSSANENQEVEPFCVANQVWDMESFSLTGNDLIMSGGYNFTTPLGYGGFKPGDLFFDIDGGGYDYVAVIGNATSTYDVYKLGTTYDVFYAQNTASNPWRYKDGGMLIEDDMDITYGSYLDAEGTHYTAQMDITWLSAVSTPGNLITIHNTMECGNDNLMGRYVSAVPESENIGIMVGFGFAALVVKKVIRK